MEFDVSVQGNFYRKIVAPNTGAALAQIIKDISDNLVPGFDPEKPHSVILSKPTIDPFDQWVAVAPSNPQRFDVWLAPDETEWIYDQPRDSGGRYIGDNPDTPEKESALKWQPHTQFDVNAAE